MSRLNVHSIDVEQQKMKPRGTQQVLFLSNDIFGLPWLCSWKMNFAGKPAAKTMTVKCKCQTNIPARPLMWKSGKKIQKIQTKSKGKKWVYTHCDLHHILYPSASSRPQLQNFKPAVEKYKWEQFSCPYL